VGVISGRIVCIDHLEAAVFKTKAVWPSARLEIRGQKSCRGFGSNQSDHEPMQAQIFFATNRIL
jgi:hypothetical protein